VWERKEKTSMFRKTVLLKGSQLIALKRAVMFNIAYQGKVFIVPFGNE
jgi:hypothetical protein